MSRLTKSMCWDLMVVKRDRLNKVAVAVYRKPNSNICYSERPFNEPPMCNESDDPNAAWYFFFLHFWLIFVLDYDVNCFFGLYRC